VGIDSRCHCAFSLIYQVGVGGSTGNIIGLIDIDSSSLRLSAQGQSGSRSRLPASLPKAHAGISRCWLESAGFLDPMPQFARVFATIPAPSVAREHQVRSGPWSESVRLPRCRMVWQLMQRRLEYLAAMARRFSQKRLARIPLPIDPAFELSARLPDTPKQHLLRLRPAYWAHCPR